MGPPPFSFYSVKNSKQYRVLLSGSWGLFLSQWERGTQDGGTAGANRVSRTLQWAGFVGPPLLLWGRLWLKSTFSSPQVPAVWLPCFQWQIHPQGAWAVILGGCSEGLLSCHLPSHH